MKALFVFVVTVVVDPAETEFQVIEAFRDARIGPHHFAGSSGYGRDDIGREALDKLYAMVMGTEDACVRSHFQARCGTLDECKKVCAIHFRSNTP